MNDLTSLTADVVAAYVAANKISTADLPGVIASVHAAMARLSVDEAEPAPAEDLTKSKAEIRKSITPDGLVSFIDGKSYSSLKRHLTKHGLTFAQYRDRYGLGPDYPSVAPAYSARRSELARSSGLGQKRQMDEVAPPEPEADPAPTATGKKPRKTRTSASGESK
jgi:predicted transcriptional regulator